MKAETDIPWNQLIDEELTLEKGWSTDHKNKRSCP